MTDDSPDTGAPRRRIVLVIERTLGASEEDLYHSRRARCLLRERFELGCRRLRRLVASSRIAVGFRRRPNLARTSAESWQPLPLESGQGALGRFSAAVRRYFDLQAGSIWDDVAEGLANVQGKVVDVGCGGQPYRPLLRPGVEYVGIDIAEAKDRFGYEAPDTVYFSGTTWPAEASSADVVLCTEALEHVLEPSQFLDRAFQALRPGGLLFVTVPFSARWHFVPYDYWRFTPSSLLHLLEGCGFADVEIFARGNALTVACYKAMALFLPLLSPQGKSSGKALLLRALGAGSAPIFVLLAVVANASLRAKGGDDCLGYTVLARRPGEPAL